MRDLISEQCDQIMASLDASDEEKATARNILAQLHENRSADQHAETRPIRARQQPQRHRFHTASDIRWQLFENKIQQELKQCPPDTDHQPTSQPPSRTCRRI